MAAEVPHPLRARARTRLYWLIGALGVVLAVYLCLPKSWFEVPDTNRPSVAAPTPAAAPLASPPPDQSLEALREAAAKSPLDFGARSRYGMALAAAGRGPAALAEFRAAARLAPEAPGVYHNLGVYYLNAGQLDLADAAFCRQLETAPGDGRAHYFRGVILAKRLQNARAIAQFRLAIALMPNFPDPYLALAMLLTRQQPEETRRLVDRYIQLTGNKALAYYVLSGAYKTRGQYAEAARYAEMTVQLEPNNYGYWHNLGQIYSYARRTDDAERALQKALSLAKDPTTVLIELGMNAQNAGRFPQAVDYLQKALAASPQTGNVHLYLARIYPRMGDQAAAQREEKLFRAWQREQLARQLAHQLARQSRHGAVPAAIHPGQSGPE
ncbi:MAG TPA: tetratricopeptide repeat protein [Chthonomonadaceae bacterium]|nr:tetratricopeptide repeat protein [Chthonomonadaceae bacterium]